MNRQPEQELERLMELLAKRATEALGEDEARELHVLSAKHPEVDHEQFDRSAAALACALVDLDASAMPAGLRDRLAITLQRLESEPELQKTPSSFTDTRGITPSAHTAASGRWSWAPWLAAAACLTAAVAGWWPRLVGVSAPDARSVSSFAARNADVVRIPWGDFNALDTGDPPEVRNVGGEVVWSDSANRGYMRLAGLPVNDPSRETYQLWIVDAERGLSQRVSGAVFDVSSSQEAIVPIEPQLPIGKAAIFAITIERPGGVVVSDMKRRASLAARPAGG